MFCVCDQLQCCYGSLLYTCIDLNVPLSHFHTILVTTADPGTSGMNMDLDFDENTDGPPTATGRLHSHLNCALTGQDIQLHIV